MFCCDEKAQETSDETRLLTCTSARWSLSFSTDMNLQCPGVGGRGSSPLIRPGAPWPCPCRRRFSPLRRREGPPPLPPTHPVRPKYPAFYRVFCSSLIFPIFRILWLEMGQHGPTWASRRTNIASRWANIAPKRDQHSPKMEQHSPQDGPT